MRRFEPLKDERVILDSPLHWRNFILPALTAGLCLAALWARLSHPYWCLTNSLMRDALRAEYVLFLTYGEAIALTLITFASGLSAVGKGFTRYYVTNKRIISTRGWLNVVTADIMLERLEAVNMTQRFWEGIFSSGDITCVSAGATIVLDDVYNARRFLHTIVQEMAELERNKRND